MSVEKPQEKSEQPIAGWVTPEKQRLLENLKENLPREQTSRPPAQQFVAASVQRLGSGDNVGMELSRKREDSFRAVGDSPKFPKQLNDYPPVQHQPAPESDEELKSHLQKERIEHEASAKLSPELYRQVEKLVSTVTSEHRRAFSNPKTLQEAEQLLQEARDLDPFVANESVKKAQENIIRRLTRQRNELLKKEEDTNVQTIPVATPVSIQGETPRASDEKVEKNSKTVAGSRDAFKNPTTLTEVQERIREARNLLKHSLSDGEELTDTEKVLSDILGKLEHQRAFLEQREARENQQKLDDVENRILQVRDFLKHEVIKNQPDHVSDDEKALSRRLSELQQLRDNLKKKLGGQSLDLIDPEEPENIVENITIDEGKPAIPEAEKNKYNKIMEETAQTSEPSNEAKSFFEITPQKKAPFEAARKMATDALDRAKKLGPVALKMVEDVGNNWNKAGTSYKYALLATAFAGVASGGVAYFAGASALLASRVGGSAAVYIGIEAMLERSRQKKETIRNKNPKLYAAAFGASVFLISEYISSIGEGAAEVPAPESVVPEPSVSTDALGEAVVPMAAAEHSVLEGDRLWNIVGGMKELANLDGAQKENAIANIVQAIRENPSEYGISSGNVDQLMVGDHIDMGKIETILETKQISGEGIIEHAKNLTPEHIENIDAQRGELIDYNIQHPEETITTEKAERILRNTGLAGAPPETPFDIDDSALGGDVVSAELSPKVSEAMTEHVKALYGESIPADWETFFESVLDTPAEDILDNTYFNGDSKEAYLQKYLELLADKSDVSPEHIGGVVPHSETIGEYVERVVPQILEKNPDWKPVS